MNVKINFKYKLLFIDIVIWLHILLYTYAAISKLTDWENFRIQLGQSPVLGAYADYLFWTVPLIEISIVTLLCFQRYRFLGLYLAFALMAVFTSYIVIVLKFSSYIPCSCGGILENMTWTQHLTFNLFFLGLAFIVLIMMVKYKNRDYPKFKFLSSK